MVILIAKTHYYYGLFFYHELPKNGLDLAQPMVPKFLHPNSYLYLLPKVPFEKQLFFWGQNMRFLVDLDY